MQDRIKRHLTSLNNFSILSAHFFPFYPIQQRYFCTKYHKYKKDNKSLV